MSNEMLTMIQPVINMALVAILGYIGKEVIKVVPKVVELLVAKIGLTNYTKLKAVAQDIWNIVEEDGRLGKLETSKIEAFKSLIRAKVPGITDGQIDLIRQAIAGEYNKDKATVVTAVENPTVVTVTPTVKYVTSEGVELKPVDTTAADNTTSNTNTSTEAKTSVEANTGTTNV